jgi:hypothetical protein
MDIDYSLIPLKEIHIHPTFSNLFPKSLPVLYGLKKHIRDNGFDTAFPLILAYGPWTQHDVLIDGHCRKKVGEELGLEEVPVVRRYFATEEEALAYVIHVQKDRRNLTDAEIVNCVATLDRKKDSSFHGNQYVRGGAQRCALPDDGKSAEKTAETLGISTRKVEQVRTILTHANEDMKQAISSSEKSINRAYQEIQAKRKIEKTRMETQQEGSVDAPDSIDNPREQDKEDDIVHDLGPEVNDSEKNPRPECWIAEIIDSLDSASIDYVVVGQGTPPANLTEDQELFLAPWMAAAQRGAVNGAEDVLNEEAASSQKPDIVDLRNYDAEGWEALEQAWAKYVPGLIPEAPEETEEKGVVEETTVEEKPSQKMNPTSDPTHEVSPISSAATETEPALDPAIAQILDLKAKEGSGNVIMEFLTQRGFIRTGSLDGIQIDRDRLLACLLDRDANNVKGFSSLLAEFKAGPKIVLPPDEDLKLDLHTNFFDYPYGAQWFWEKCRTVDDNGLILNDKRFAANVGAFMAQYGLMSVKDIVRKVAQMNEELSPRRALSETSSSLQSARIAS